MSTCIGLFTGILRNGTGLDKTSHVTGLHLAFWRLIRVMHGQDQSPDILRQGHCLVAKGIYIHFSQN